MGRRKINKAHMRADLLRVFEMLTDGQKMTVEFYKLHGRYSIGTVIGTYGTWVQMKIKLKMMDPAELETFSGNSKPKPDIDQSKVIPCLKCDADFKSRDPKKNRICPGCQHSLRADADLW